MEAFGPCLPNNRAGGDFIRFVYLHVDVDTLADADNYVVVDVGVVALLTLMLICHLCNLIRYLLKCRFCCEC